MRPKVGRGGGWRHGTRSGLQSGAGCRAGRAGERGRAAKRGTECGTEQGLQRGAAARELQSGGRAGCRPEAERELQSGSCRLRGLQSGSCRAGGCRAGAEREGAPRSARLDGVLRQHGAVQLHRRQAQVLGDVAVLDRELRVGWRTMSEELGPRDGAGRETAAAAMRALSGRCWPGCATGERRDGQLNGRSVLKSAEKGANAHTAAGVDVL